MPESGKLNIVQGEYRVTGDPGVVITTLLGSCVAACLHDPLARVGGMNHFLLPGELKAGQSERLGVHLMELLVNGLLKHGASKDRLIAKLFGGAKMVDGLNDIGERNGLFARRFLEREGIPVVASSIGGATGRRIQFWPASGKARQLFMAERLPDPEPIARKLAASATGEVEFF